MFSLEGFVDECHHALTAHDPVVAICATLKKAIVDPDAIAEAMEKNQPGGAQAGALVHRSDDLTIMHVVAAPGFTSPAHDHTLWAIVGQYKGQEDNRFFEEREGQLVEVGTRSIHAGEVVPLDDTVIHAIKNPRSEEPCCALHVYGGDLIGAERSFWEPETGTRKSAKTGEMQAAIERLNG
jgi:predicted metal-dependent enzyme (double-stranded beta helix superfamily)